MELKGGRLKFNTTQLNRSLNRFKVTHISLKVDQNRTLLVIDLQRLNSSFWLSLFIPSISLVLVAEIMLFIKDEHFKATITVSLTANLVMYTMYRNIQDKLPEDSKLKLIDIWLLHGLLMPMVVFMVLVANEMIDHEVTKTGPCESNRKVSNSSVKIDTKVVNEAVEKARSKICILVCKTLIPVTSFIFTVTFFFVIALPNS